MTAASAIIAPTRRATNAAAAGGATSMPNTNSVPTTWKDATTTKATSTIIARCVQRGEKPDLAKAIKLDSQFNKSGDTTEHLVVDLGPGWGKNEGKAVVLLGFGNLWLDGAISDAS